MGNSEKYASGKKKIGVQIMKVANEGMKRETFHLKKWLHTII